MKSVILIDDDGIMENESDCGDFYYIDDVEFIHKDICDTKNEIDPKIGK